MSETVIKLEIGGLGTTTKPTVEKLIKGGYLTVNSVAYATAKEITENTEIAGEDTAQKAIDSAREVIGSGFISAETLYERQLEKPKLHTGSHEVDKILGGGIMTGVITEFAAKGKVGKTQICNTLSVICPRPIEEGGLGGKVIYIDTENTFMPSRIVQIAEARGYDGQEALRNILVAKSNTSEHLTTLVKQLNYLAETHGVKLVVVDSLIAQFRNEYKGRGELASRQQEINSVIGLLLRVARANDVAVVITNQMVSKPDSMYSNPDNPAGGHVIGHGNSIRVLLRLGGKGSRLARIDDSSFLPEDTARYWITEAGVVDDAKLTSPTDFNDDSVEDEEEIEI